MKTLKFAAIACVVALSACSSESDARKALRQAGYTDVQITGYAPFSCGKDDSFSTGFVAKGPNGQVATGVVCSAWMKGSTIRLN